MYLCKTLRLQGINDKTMAHRFYVPETLASGQRLRLPDEEASHLTRALRLEAGATIRVFDGCGHEFTARVETVSRTGVFVETQTSIDPTPEPEVAVTLAQAVLKGRHFDTVVRDATMLGVATIQPLLTTYTDMRKSAALRPALRSRWQRVAIAAAKQSGRAFVPHVREVASFDEHLSQLANTTHLILVEPGHVCAAAEPEKWRHRAPPSSATLSVGPEGGWTDAELTHATAEGAEPVTLGTRTLRADAVPVVALSVLQFAWGDL